MKKKFDFLLFIIIPVITITIAIIFTFNPTFFGIKIDRNDIIMSLFTMLAIDSIIDKYFFRNKLLNSIQTLSLKISKLKSGNILKKRQDFDRLDNIFAKSKKELFVSGINLEAVVPACNTIKLKAEHGCHIRLLALNPNGFTLQSSSKMSGVNIERRKSKILSNLEFIKEEFKEFIEKGNIELKVLDSPMPFSFIGIDIYDKKGRLIVQQYLYKTQSEYSPMTELTRDDSYWYDLYIGQLEKIWNDGTAI